MARKEVYDYTLWLDSKDVISFENEEGPLEKPKIPIAMCWLAYSAALP